jgi:hypothetical protein
MAVWFMRWLQCPLSEGFVPASNSLPTSEAWQHQHINVETTCCTRESVRKP